MIFMMFYRLKKVLVLLDVEKDGQIFNVNCILSTEAPFVPSDSENSDEDDVEQIVKANLIQKSLLTPALDQKMGAWEAHTKVSFCHFWDFK